jgi:hypothetical protein
MPSISRSPLTISRHLEEPYIGVGRSLDIALKHPSAFLQRTDQRGRSRGGGTAREYLVGGKGLRPDVRVQVRYYGTASGDLTWPIWAPSSGVQSH